MKLNVQFVSNPDGNIVSVQIPFNEWKSYEREHQKLQQYYKMRGKLKAAHMEFQEIKAGKKDSITLKEFLNEC
jgi:hypothetical protein